MSGSGGIRTGSICSAGRTANSRPVCIGKFGVNALFGLCAVNVPSDVRTCLGLFASDWRQVYNYYHQREHNPNSDIVSRASQHCTCSLKILEGEIIGRDIMFSDKRSPLVVFENPGVSGI